MPMESTQRRRVGARHRRLVWGGVHFWYRCSSRAPSLCPKAVLWLQIRQQPFLLGTKLAKFSACATGAPSPIAG